MKIGIDAVLLGASASLAGCGPLLDIGTGTGILALMLAQRYPQLSVDAVEVNADAAAQAAENVQASPYLDRIRVHQAAIQAWAGDSYGDIISNPPYFGGQPAAAATARRQARQGEGLDPDTFALAARRLARADARLHLILPVSVWLVWQEALGRASWWPAHLTWIHPRQQQPADRVILRLTSQPCVPRDKHLTVHGRAPGTYHQDFLAITREYYLPGALTPEVAPPQAAPVTEALA